MKKYLLIVLFGLLTFSACSNQEAINNTFNISTAINEKNNSFTDSSTKIIDDQLPHQELYAYPEWVNGCDRFRPIFEEKLEEYSIVAEYFDLEDIYALTYQESLCQTREEMKLFLEQKKDPSQTWKGGIMQVDSCFKWDTGYDCELVQDQINYGFTELQKAINKIKESADSKGITLSKEEMLKSVFIAYNRGYYVVTDAFDLLNNLKNQDPTKVLVNCTEKDVCMSDEEIIDVSKEFATLEDDFEKALFLSCKKNYGTMYNAQGDYCTGPGYGLNYPKDIFKITDSIKNFDFTAEPKVQKEFYGGQIKFSDRLWLVKTSIDNKTGPGPNYFNHEKDAVYVDENDALHMKIMQKEDKWLSTEILLPALGYGKYTFYLAGDLSNLDANAILGLFTYDLAFETSENYYHREIDVEFAKWGYPEIENVQFAMQGPLPLTAIKRFFMNSSQDLIVSFDWTKENVSFEMKTTTGEIINSWYYEGELVPDEGNENTRINLWLTNGKPYNNKSIEIIINKFEFEKQ